MNARAVTYWATTILISLAFLTGGAAYLFRLDAPVQGMAALGYPAYFVTILGIWKVLGGFAILAPGLPRLKEWAYAGITFDLTGAAASHAAVGDPTAKVIVPLVLLGMAAASWRSGLRAAFSAPSPPNRSRQKPMRRWWRKQRPDAWPANFAPTAEWRAIMKARTNSLIICCWLFTALSMLFMPAARGDNWPQWRGPRGDGVSSESGLPSEFGDGKNMVWKLALPGMGASTPVVWDEHIFLTSQDGDDVDLLSITTAGKVAWKRSLGPGKSRFRRDEANQASPSPCTDGRHVYAFTGAGDFACFDFAGKPVWHFNVQDRYGPFQIQFGMHVTPLLHDDRLYLPLLHSGGWWVIALDKATGKEVWKVQRQSDAQAECEQSYASPCIGHDGRQAYLIIHGCDYTTAHRLDNGAELWRLGELNPQTAYNRTLRFVASPAASDDVIVVPTAKNGPVVGVKPGAQGKIAPGSPFEEWRRPHNTPDVPSPLVYGGFVYLCRETGVLICLDTKTGQERYQERLIGGRYRASPVGADGKVYCTARDGTVSVIRAGAKFELMGVNHLHDQVAASPAVANGRIYFRGFDALYAVGLK